LDLSSIGYVIREADTSFNLLDVDLAVFLESVIWVKVGSWMLWNSEVGMNLVVTEDEKFVSVILDRLA